MQDESQPFDIAIDHFDGPIDLLLHLVKRNELPIESLSLAKVTAQYLEAIKKLEVIDFDLVGEYLVVAATLVSIKAATLLNEKPDLPLEEESGGFDPHEELLRRLREAAVFQQSALKLSRTPQFGIDVFCAAPPASAVVSEVVLKDHHPLLLGKALKKLLQKRGESARTLVITMEFVSLGERMVKVLELLKPGKVVLFDDIFNDSHTLPNIITSFLAILELCKQQMVEVWQNELFGEISVVLKGDAENKELQEPDSDVVESNVGVENLVFAGGM